MVNSYYFIGGTGAIVSDDGSQIKVTGATSNFKLNVPSAINDFAIEFTVLSSSGNVALGVGDYDTASTRTRYSGYYTTGMSVNISDGMLYNNNITSSGLVVATNFKATQNDIVALKVDSKNNKVQFFKNGVEVYSHPIVFSYNKLIFEVGTGSQVNGEIKINYDWIYDYDTFRYDNTKTKRLAIKNKTTNQHYSLAEKTLIPLPNASPETVITHGIKAGKEIRLDEAFDKVNYIQETSDIFETGKVFKQKMNISKIKKVEITKE